MRQTTVYNNAIAQFEKLYPNIDVKLKLYTDYQRIYNDVITNIPTRTTPNVCITYPDHIATYMMGKNIVLALDEVMADEKYGLGGSEVRFDAPSKSEIIPKFLEEGVLNSQQYALPFMRSTEACYINKDAVESLGFEIPDVLTWDFIFEVSEAAIALGKTTVTDDNGNSSEVYNATGQSVLIPFIYKSTDNMMIQMLKQLGADYSNENGDILIFNDDTKDILYTVAESAEIGAFSTFKISSYPANYFNAGQCIFAIDSTAGSAWMGSSAPLLDIDEEALVNFETFVRSVPQYNVDEPKMISQGPSICVFNQEDPQVVLASWLFAQFLLTNEVQLGYAKTEGYVPVTSKAQESKEYTDYLSKAGELDEKGDNYLYYDIKIAATKLLLDNIENTFVTPVFNGSASLRNAAGQMIEKVTNTARFTNTEITDEYISDLYSDMYSLYHLDRRSMNPDDNVITAIPSESIVLIALIGSVWLVIIGYVSYQTIKKRKNNS